MKVIKYLILSATALFIIVILSRNLNSPGIWFDESATFWMAKGISPFSADVSNNRGIKAVIIENRLHNLDPGGYTILLHFWSGVSANYIWLRLLSFLFLIGTMIIFGFLTYRWTGSIFLAFLTGLLPSFAPMLVHYAFEIRAYSMEYFSMAMIVLITESIKKEPADIKLFLSGLFMAIFLTSRYSAIIPVIAASLFIFYLIYFKKATTKQKLLSACLFCIPIFISLLLVWFFTLRFQDTTANSPVYLQNQILKYNLAFLGNPYTILYNVPFILFIILLLTTRKRFHNIAEKFNVLVYFIISINVLFILLSVAGKHPYDIYQRWCISLYLLSILTIAAFISCLYLIFKTRFPGYLTNIHSLLIIGITCIIMAVTHFYGKIPRIGKLIYIQSDNTYDHLSKIDLAKYNKIYVNATAIPTVRYLFEFGGLKNSDNRKFYPSKFFFESEMVKEKNIDNIDPNKFDLIVASHHLLSPMNSNTKWKLLMNDKGQIWESLHTSLDTDQNNK